MATATDNQLPPTEITALLGRGTRFEGKLHFDGRVRVDGYFQGEINSDDTLIIGDGAEVHAEIEVATVIVRGGQVHGNIKARNAIEIHAPGKMIGNLHSPSLFIDRGVEFQGSCRMDPIEDKTTTAVTAANTPIAKAAAPTGPSAPLPPAAPSAPSAPSAPASAASVATPAGAAEQVASERVIRGASVAIAVALASVNVGLSAGCGLGRPPSPTVEAGAPPVLDAGADAGAAAATTPLPSADELVRLAEETIRGGHAAHVHDGRAPFTAPVDLPNGGCGRVALVADQPVGARIEDPTGPRGDAVDAGAHVLTLLPPAGPVCGASGAVTLDVTSGAGNVRWTTVTR